LDESTEAFVVGVAEVFTSPRCIQNGCSEAAGRPVPMVLRLVGGRCLAAFPVPVAFGSNRFVGVKLKRSKLNPLPRIK